QGWSVQANPGEPGRPNSGRCVVPPGQVQHLTGAARQLSETMVEVEGPVMLGAIAGDVIGSVHEGARTKTKDFPLFTPGSRFTDDTVLTIAVAECLLRGRDYVDMF